MTPSHQLHLLLAALVLGGCSPISEPSELVSHELQSRELQSPNGLSANGLSANGLSANGLSANGLSANGLSAADFQAWFQSNPTVAESVMRYLVLCAAPAGQTLSYTDATTGQGYSWSGRLGLAPGWSSGQPATVSEQQVISACLAAHVNKYGVHIPLSVLGRSAQGQPIPFTLPELVTFSQREACFFGNLFTHQGIYVGSDRGNLSARESSARACSISSNAGNARTTDCAPLMYAGTCTTFCTLDASKTYYTSCTYNGVTYRPITTRLRPDDIYLCGDGVCQISESCGTSTQYNNCLLDCGACP
ncbi:hypothetical protein [Hyalangium gracile]|uniref:hypothetical protein n=1 Tax=Hyalangium gracile TaxID=394092 RepID=UPI001CCFDC63|nr:hypothetical protein [Hyalangium gracile]